MDILRGSAVSACFLGIVFSVMGNLVPSEKFARQINVIFSLILALVIIPPFIGADIELPDFSDGDRILEDYSEIAEIRLMEEIQENICDSLAELLNGYEIYPLKISVDINNSADGSISINKAEITLSDERYADAARRIVSEALGGAEVNVQIEGSENQSGY